jgi:divalent metal cation (Fe/Co/Zn/Cd) transporter
VSRTLPLDRVTAIKGEIENAVRAEFPKAETAVNIEPHALDDETVLERVMVIARNRALAVHHITVQSVGGRLAVSLDLELGGSLTLGQAHEIASGLEQAARDELGPEVEVETHIEPLQLSDLAGRDALPGRVAEVRAELANLAAGSDFVRDVHEVRVRETGDGEIVNFHGYADPGLTVSDVHEKVDELERALRQRFPSIKRVIGHAEPR